MSDRTDATASPGCPAIPSPAGGGRGLPIIHGLCPPDFETSSLVSLATATPTPQAAITELKNMADHHMRELIRSIPDGVYHGEAVLEDSGHGLGAT